MTFSSGELVRSMLCIDMRRGEMGVGGAEMERFANHIHNTQMVAVALGPWASHSEDQAEP